MSKYVDWQAFRIIAGIGFSLTCVAGFIVGIVFTAMFDWRWLFLVVPVGVLVCALAISFFSKVMDETL